MEKAMSLQESPRVIPMPGSNGGKILERVVMTEITQGQNSPDLERESSHHTWNIMLQLTSPLRQLTY
jgi:hypothetical protein